MRVCILASVRTRARSRCTSGRTSKRATCWRTSSAGSTACRRTTIAGATCWHKFYHGATKLPTLPTITQSRFKNQFVALRKREDFVLHVPQTSCGAPDLRAARHADQCSSSAESAEQLLPDILVVIKLVLKGQLTRKLVNTGC